MKIEKIKRPLLRYHGGKYLLAKWIISNFPKHKIYVEPFGGAASVLLQKPRCYAEVYNDIGSEIVNLFKVVREKGDELIQLLEKTPFSRVEFNNSYLPTSDCLEQARRTVIRSFMGFGSVAASNRKTGFRANSNRSGSTPAHDWVNYPKHLNTIIDRLQGVVIENKEALSIMEQQDSSETLHYVDPPYVKNTRYKGDKTNVYNREMDDNDHLELCNFLKGLKGHVVLSAYENDLYNLELKSWFKYSKNTYADGAKKRKEILYVNKVDILL